MKKTIVKTAFIAFIALSVTACKNNKETSNEALNEASEASTTSVEYKANTASSVIAWHGSKPLGTHNGTVKLASGSISVKGDLIEAGNFAIDMNTITDNDLEGESKLNLEAHLKGTVEGKEGDFFNVTKYPTATFEITSVSAIAGNKSLIKGNLTIKDKTNPIEFPATVTFSENGMTLLSDTFSIDRTKWGVNYGSKSIFDDLGDKFISDEMELTIELHATK